MLLQMFAVPVILNFVLIPKPPAPIEWLLSLAVGVGVVLLIWRTLIKGDPEPLPVVLTMLAGLIAVVVADQIISGGRLLNAVAAGLAYLATFGGTISISP